MMVAAIMQPTYLPWVGYLDLIDRVDRFVLLDSVEFDARSWQQRNRIKTPTGLQWLTVPVLTRGRRGQRIIEVEIDGTRKFAERHTKTIRQYYARASFFDEHHPTMVEVFETGYECLAELNVDLLRWLCERFGIDTPVIRSSDLAARARRSNLLVAICREIGAHQYVSPQGSRDYLEADGSFAEAGIELVYHEYIHPEYSQLWGDFISHASALDLLLNEGPRSLQIMRSGRIPHQT